MKSLMSVGSVTYDYEQWPILIPHLVTDDTTNIYFKSQKMGEGDFKGLENFKKPSNL